LPEALPRNPFLRRAIFLHFKVYKSFQKKKLPE
jgi:hypothetical protein